MGAGCVTGQGIWWYSWCLSLVGTKALPGIGGGLWEASCCLFCESSSSTSVFSSPQENIQSHHLLPREGRWGR